MTYPLQQSEREVPWYRKQGKLYESWTKLMISEAGIGLGMRVLDLGCGAGDVSMLLAEAVGPGGRVLGIDCSETSVIAARTRAEMAGLENTEFRQGDIRDLPSCELVDAAVGRFVLMYVDEPAKMIAGLKKSVRAGGQIMFIEPDYSGAQATGNLPLFQDLQEKIERTMRLSGVDTRVGLKLAGLFRAAGLPSPELRLGAAIGSGPDFAGYEVAAGFVDLLLPAMERLGVATREDMSLGTLVDRLRAEVVGSGGVVVFPSLVAAWSRWL